MMVQLVARPRWLALALGVLACSPSDQPPDAPEPESPYVADPACPGEGCMYGQWLACDSLPLLSEPDPRARPLGWLERDQWFEVERAIVIVREPATYVAHRSVQDDSVGWDSWLPLAAGDTLFVLDYIGEGFHNVLWRDSIQESFQFWLGQRPDTIHPSLSRLRSGSNELWASTRLPDAQLSWVHVVVPSVFTRSQFGMMPETCPTPR